MTQSFLLFIYFFLKEDEIVLLSRKQCNYLFVIMVFCPWGGVLLALFGKKCLQKSNSFVHQPIFFRLKKFTVYKLEVSNSVT